MSQSPFWKHHDRLRQHLANFVAAYTCDGGQVPCGPVMSIDQIFDDPHYRERGNLLSFEHGRIGAVTIPNVVPALDGNPGGVRSLGPSLGEHSEEILNGLLGLTGDAVLELRRSGADG